jgi:hypothetical protein
MPKFCPNCGTEISDKVKFCQSCGADIESFSLKKDEKSVIEDKEIDTTYSITYLVVYGVIIGIIIFVLFIVLGTFIAGMTGNIHSIQGQSTTQPQNPVVQNYFVPTPTESQTNRNIRIVKGIVEDYYKTHTYSLNDLFVCGDMATDVWNMVETQGINSVLYIGNVEKNISKIEDANHAWVLAEISPNHWLALETTGGYVVCNYSDICPVHNPLYYHGWRFTSPKEMKDALDKLKHPCPDGYIFGSDDKCHLACGPNTYCTGTSICINGKCLGCTPGHILGDDFNCYKECPPIGSGKYCKTGVCGTDGRCHLW